MAMVAQRLRIRRVVLVPLAGLLVLLIVAWLAYAAGSSSSGGYDSGTSSTYAVPSSSGPSYPGSEAAPAAPAVGDAAAPSRTDAGGKAAAPPVVSPDRSLVRSVSLSIDVPDPAAAVGRVRTTVAAVGGYVSQEQTSDDSSSLVLQVPADALDRTLDQLAGVGTVTSRRSETADVTDTVVDLGARVASQRASVDRVRQLLAKATTIGDVVAIESELAQREADLDSLTSRLAAVSGRVALSTITVQLTGPSGAVPADRPNGGFLDGLADGWDAVRAVGSAAGTAVGFLLPFVPVVALVVGAGVLVRRRRRVSGQGGPGSDGES